MRLDLNLLLYGVLLLLLLTLFLGSLFRARRSAEEADGHDASPSDGAYTKEHGEQEGGPW